MNTINYMGYEVKKQLVVVPIFSRSRGLFLMQSSAQCINVFLREVFEFRGLVKVHPNFWTSVFFHGIHAMEVHRHIFRSAADLLLIRSLFLNETHFSSPPGMTAEDLYSVNWSAFMTPFKSTNFHHIFELSSSSVDSFSSQVPVTLL